MIGRTLGGRYIVETRVGGGGMASVYRGVDGLLHRQVALKVLRSQFADNAEFVARFRREARAAASLSHSNIVAVHDVGQEGADCYYIVQEYIDGRTLKERIQDEGPLTTTDALTITQQVLRALGHAHAVGVIHRDVKPQNVLLTQDGRVKVTDFGIARAEAAVTFVHTGAILGTAHYAAPEQVRGQPTDLRCDLYSTGVMLFEMLAGHPPFDGDSPLAVALQHVEQPVPDLHAVRPDIGVDVAAIVAHAMAKSPEDRYRTILEMQADVEAVLDGAPLRFAPLPPAAPREGGEAASPVAAGPPTAGLMAHSVASAMPPPGAERAGAGWARVAAVTAGIVVGVAILGGGAIALAAHWLNVREVSVPAVVGEDLGAAEGSISGAGLLVSVDQGHSTQVPSGQVERTDPVPGTRLRQGATVTIWQSLGPTVVALPDVAGLALTAAKTELTGLGLSPGEAATPGPSADVPVGYVISSTPPAGATVPTGASVTLLVSAGPAGAGQMPDYVGWTLQNTQSDMAQRQLSIGSVSRQPTGWPSGFVAATMPVAGAAAPAGTTVDLTLSSGCLYQVAHAFQAGATPAAPASAATTGSTPATAPGAASATTAAPPPATATAGSAPTAAGPREQVLMQDVGQPNSRLIFDQTVAPGQPFLVQLCWSAPQGASWTWEENGALEGSGKVDATTAAGKQSASNPPAASLGAPTGTPPATSSTSVAGDGVLPPQPGTPGSAGVPSASSTRSGP